MAGVWETLFHSIQKVKPYILHYFILHLTNCSRNTFCAHITSGLGPGQVAQSEHHPDTTPRLLVQPPVNQGTYKKQPMNA